MIKLDICGGSAPKNGFLNVDIDFDVADIVADISESLPFRNESVDEIWSCHTIEHFTKEKGIEILDEFWRVLKQNGILNIACPCLKSICKAYLSRDLDMKKIQWYLHGAQTNQYDFHEIVWDVEWLAIFLRRTGFKNVREVPYTYQQHIRKLTFQLRGEK